MVDLCSYCRPTDKIIMNVSYKLLAITLPDAVNFIMKLTNQELQTLGNNLGLDEARVKEVISPYYDLSEQHQRLMELWFRKESNPMWGKLQESMPSGDHTRRSVSSYHRESSTSIVRVPITPVPLSPTGEILQCMYYMTFNVIGVQGHRQGG